jgi:polyribonucleotide nucleotidyltransferase
LQRCRITSSSTSAGDSWAEVEVGSGVVRFAAGQYARLADGACVVSLGDTQVLATAVSDATFDETRDFLPLQVT